MPPPSQTWHPWDTTRSPNGAIGIISKRDRLLAIAKQSKQEEPM